MIDMKILYLCVSVFCLTFICSPLWSDEATIQEVHGSVYIIDPDGESQTATLNQKVPMGYEVQTERNAYCEIALDSENTFRVKEETLIQIEKLNEASKKPDGSVVKITRINLFEGELSAKLENLPKDSEFEILSPVAIAGATGTAFSVTYHDHDHHTHISVHDDVVHATSRGELHKSVNVVQMRKVEIVPWEYSIVSTQGRAVLSEAILGRDFIQQAQSQIQIEAQGQGSTKGEAITLAREALTILILNLYVNPDQTLDQVLIEDPLLTQKVFFAISQARVLGTSENPDATFTAKVQIHSSKLADIIGQPLYGLRQNIIPLSMMEYSQKFGAKARVTTERAAKVEGYRNLAEIIYGTVINSQTTVKDYAVQDDTIRTTIEGMVRGARVVNKAYFSDGSIMLGLEIDGSLIPDQLSPTTGDVFGKHYMSSPQIISFESYHEYYTR